MSRTVGLITIHGIDNFGSLLQTYATQTFLESLGYRCEIINYKYPNDYHLRKASEKSPYARVELSLLQRIRFHFYHKYFSKRVLEKKHARFESIRNQLLKVSKVYENQDALIKGGPKYDIYLTGSDQVWNPRYMYEDTSYLLSFTDSPNKLAFSASFGTTAIDEYHQSIMKPLLAQYLRISTRESSGVNLVREICGKEAICTCDPTLLLSGKDWATIFNDKPIIPGKYILCYILTYTANPYPYAYRFVNYIKKVLKLKVVFIDEGGLYWGDFFNKSLQVYGPNDIINLFCNASFIVSSSFHGAAFSLNFKKDFFSIFPRDVKDERQESLLKIVGAEDRLVRVGDPFPQKERILIKNWVGIESRLNKHVSLSIKYLKDSLALCK